MFMNIEQASSKEAEKEIKRKRNRVEEFGGSVEMSYSLLIGVELLSGGAIPASGLDRVSSLGLDRWIGRGSVARAILVGRFGFPSRSSSGTNFLPWI